LAPGDDPTLPTACVAKDVWVLGWTTPPVVAPPRLPQVDFGRSVPTRAADALYWTNRAAERSEAIARALRVVFSRVEQDPGLAALQGGEWCRRMGSLVQRVRRAPISIDGIAGLDELHDELDLTFEAVASEVGIVLTEATTVREFLSVTTGRVLSQLGELRTSMERHDVAVDDLDAVLAHFAAIAGLWQESTVRGPAWRIGDTGRRLERCLVVLDLIQGALHGTPIDGGTDVDESTIEVLLAANDSLVAYRRRHRSEVDLALRLLVQDASNPRSLAASIDRLARHAADGEDALDDEFLWAARGALELPTAEMIPTMRRLIDDAGERIVGRWFSTPVNPVPFTARGG
jgi:uncharacterized alpha-E superfamily protein